MCGSESEKLLLCHWLLQEEICRLVTISRNGHQCKLMLVYSTHFSHFMCFDVQGEFCHILWQPMTCSSHFQFRKSSKGTWNVVLVSLAAFVSMHYIMSIKYQHIFLLVTATNVLFFSRFVCIAVLRDACDFQLTKDLAWSKLHCKFNGANVILILVWIDEFLNYMSWALLRVYCSCDQERFIQFGTPHPQ